MNEHLSLDTLLECNEFSFRYFQKHEKHVSRVCPVDVLILMFDGTLRLRENGVDIEIKKNEYYIERQGSIQEGLKESDEPKYYYIHFFGDYSPTKRSIPLRGTADITTLVPLCHELELLKVTSAPKIALASVFYRILFELSKTQTPSLQRTIVQDVLSYVLQNFERPVTMDEISAAVGYCKNHITNSFQKNTGKSPHAYITEQRIDAAKRFLLNSTLSLEQISKECGFGTYINFYKSFVKKEKISPSDWRHLHQYLY